VTTRLDGARAIVDVAGVAVFALEADGRATARAARGRRVLAEDVWRRIALPLFMQRAGWELLHASAALLDQGVIGFAAPSLTGKSTLAAAFGARGHTVFADDALLWTLEDGAFVAATLGAPLRLRAETRDSWVGAQTSAVREQASFATARLAAIAVLERTPAGVAPTVDRLARREAFAAVAPHLWAFSLDDPARTKTMMERMLALADGLSVLRVRVPSSLDALPAVCDAVERALR
jgi:hypothetical protein